MPHSHLMSSYSTLFCQDELDLPERFFTINAKPYEYLGSQAIAIYMSDVTQKTRAKLQSMQLMEKKQEIVQAESYKSTISHELRTPLQSIALIIKLIIKLV